MVSAPLISVVLPVYNAGPFLESALESVLGQTMSDLELIVVDDASEDGSHATAGRYAARDPRVRLVRQEHAGVAVALNTGMELACAPWIALHASDDVSLPRRLERQLEFLSANTDIAVLGTWGWRTGSHGREIGVFDAGPLTRMEFDKLRRANEPIYLLATSVVFARDVGLAVGGFRTSAGAAEDIDLWTRIADTHTVLALPERLVRYRIHANSISTTRFFQQMEDALRVRENAARRRSGQPEVERAPFHTRLAAQPLPHRLGRMLRWRSQHSYRVAGGLIADRRPVGLVWLALSFALWPSLPAQRLKRQLLPWVRERVAGSAAPG
jgi:glycosyltransferase involved in cell wall biosynthesis